MKTISIPVNNRPDHLRRVLESIKAADGHEEWQLCFSIEPSANLIATHGVGFHSFNSVKRGCWTNTFLAADLAMSLGSDLNLYLEDDYLITQDTLTMVSQWAVSNNDGVLCLRRANESQQDKSNEVSEMESGLFGCGFAWRKPMWGHVRHGWFSDGENGYQMWDISIASFFKELGVPQWRPMVNRSHGIGLTGTHSNGDSADLNLFGSAYQGPPVKEFRFV